MRHANLPGTRLQASRIALGTAWFGTTISEDDAFKLLDAYAQHGGNFLDTAHMYASWVKDGAGKSETTLGKWIQSRGRKNILIATKGADKGMTRDGIRAQLNESFDRLKLDKVDFYWLHRDDPSVPAKDIIDWLNELVRERRFPAFGCSNWSSSRIDEAQSHAKSKNIAGFAASQIGWSLAKVNPEVKLGGQVFMDDATLDWHRRTALPQIAYSAQAGGFFAGAYDPAGPQHGLKPNPNIVKFHGTPDNYRRLAQVKLLANVRNVSPNQVAIAYLLNQPFPTFAICGANSVDRMKDTCDAADLILSANEVAGLANPPA